MIRKAFILTIAGLISTAVFSQDIYQVAELSTSDLSGTARYVGMGGAMGALGGDLSTMSDNPAAIGLYRHSDVAATASLVTMPGSHKFDDKNPTYVSFDQAGFVYTFNLGNDKLKFVNIGFNYHKSHDFNQLLNAVNANLSAADNASQTWQLADLCNDWGGVNNATPLANMAWDAYLLGDDGNGNYTAYNASDNIYGKARWGSNQAFDFNISTNLRDQFYLGLTVSGYQVKQKSYMEYSEGLLDNNGIFDGEYWMANESKLSGSGYDMKVGFIVRPVKQSNFKIGVAVSTPTFYNLTYRDDLYLYANTATNGEYEPRPYYFDYDYKVRGPWKVNVSLGNTFFNRLAVGAEYEFADYSSCSVSYGDDWGDWDDWDWSTGTKDRELNKQIDKYLKGTHTLKVGAEVMVTPNLFLRGGYNYVSSSFDKDAWLNHFINSASVDAATNTDYLNLSGINRYSAGLGFKAGKFYADATWLYQHQRGTLYAFNAAADPTDPVFVNACPSNRLSLNKSQVILTMGLRF